MHDLNDIPQIEPAPCDSGLCHHSAHRACTNNHDRTCKAFRDYAETGEFNIDFIGRNIFKCQAKQT